MCSILFPMSKWGAAAACWAFYDDRDDRLTEILRLLPEAFPSSLSDLTRNWIER